MSDDDLSAPIVLERRAKGLPSGLVSEDAFRWPGEAMARGGMAEIFSGEDRRLTRTVILKTPRADDGLADSLKKMFEQRVVAEAQILAKLQHPSIVTIYELGRSTVGWPFCVMEKVSGVALRDRLDELTAEEVATGKRQTRARLELLSSLVAIVEAVAYAHERRVVHRDITPNNILIGSRGEATLIDWGIARDLDSDGTDPAGLDGAPSMSGRWSTINAGTPPYVPYEQTQGLPAHPAYDVYSLGMTLYEVIAGRTPFEWKLLDDLDARQKQVTAFLEWLRDPPPHPSAVPDDPELSGIIARAITRDQTERFTADELLRALKQYLTGELVFSHRYSKSGRLIRWLRAHKAVTVGMIAAVLVGVAGLIVWVQLSRQAREKAELAEAKAAAEIRAMSSESQATIAAGEADVARRRADDAGARADKARLEAEAAERQGKADSALRARAEAAAKEAADERAKADGAANRAAQAQAAAETERDAAKAAQAQAEASRAAATSDRDAAQASRAEADRLREAADAARRAAETERDAAKEARARAEQASQEAGAQRDRALEDRTRAEAERDEARTAAERAAQAQADAERKLAALEARVRELEQRTQPAPP